MKGAVLTVIDDAAWDRVIAASRPVSEDLANLDIEVMASRHRRHEREGGRRPGASTAFFAKRWGWKHGRVWVHFLLLEGQRKRDAAKAAS